MTFPLFEAIHHVAIIASDYDRSRHFYHQELGLPILAAFVVWRRLPLAVPRACWPRLAQLTLFNMVLWNSLIIIAIPMLSSGRAAILGYTMPIFSAVLGSLFFHDRLAPRAERAGVTCIERLLLDQGHEARALAPLAGQADIVLVDAPCSGTGTWRRNPEARWRLTQARLDRLVSEQARILDFAAPLLAPGGLLVYATCALTDREGRDQVDAFLARQAGWSAEPIEADMGRAHGRGLLLTPGHDGTDGFYFARLRRTA